MNTGNAGPGAPDRSEAVRRTGPSVGLLMLETAFPRPVGDVGNRNTFGFPVTFERVRGASVDRVVHAGAAGLLAPFVDAGRRLVRRGAAAIGTSCGFLVLYQHELAAALPVPVAASSLIQVPWVNAVVGGARRCGVITFDADSLGPEHLRAAGAPPDTPVAGMPRGGALQSAIRADGTGFDPEAIRAEALRVARRLVREHAHVGAIVLECTNLSPYAPALRSELGLPVYDVVTMLEWLWRGVGGERRV